MVRHAREGRLLSAGRSRTGDAAFLSQNHIDPAIAVEMFVLEGEGGDEISDVQIP